MLSELRRTSLAIRWLVTLQDHGDVPGVIQEAARKASAELIRLRGELFMPEAVERSIAEAWRDWKRTENGE